MASSVSPDTFEKLRLMRASTQINLCANCFVFHWKEVKPDSLQKCGRCKVLQYCSKECQEEHWDMVHKEHCGKMARARKSAESVGIYSHHPFPATGSFGATFLPKN